MKRREPIRAAKQKERRELHKRGRAMLVIVFISGGWPIAVKSDHAWSASHTKNRFQTGWEREMRHGPLLTSIPSLTAASAENFGWSSDLNLPGRNCTTVLNPNLDHCRNYPCDTHPPSRRLLYYSNQSSWCETRDANNLSINQPT